MVLGGAARRPQVTAVVVRTAGTVIEQSVAFGRNGWPPAATKDYPTALAVFDAAAAGAFAFGRDG